MDELALNQISPFLIKISEHHIEGDFTAFAKDARILIVDIPPQLRSGSGENFVSKIETLIKSIALTSIRKVLFVSSTSVYADDHHHSTATEEAEPRPDTESGRQLLESENLLQNQSGFQSTILRFGGLIGPDRHPIKFLAGKVGVANADAPINLIHQSDCIDIIKTILKLNRWNQIYNAVAPSHPTRSDYYTRKAAELNLAAPVFSTDKSIGKIVSSEKIMQLGYEFIKSEL